MSASMVERVETAMTTYTEGSLSTGVNPTLWMIFKGDECVFSCPDRLERDVALRRMNTRAVIEAMREPTEAMLAIWADVGDTRDKAAAIWRAMLDAALGDKP